MHGVNLVYCLQLHDNFPSNHKIKPVTAVQLFALVLDGQGFLLLTSDSLQ